MPTIIAALAVIHVDNAAGLHAVAGRPLKRSQHTLTESSEQGMVPM